MESSCHLRDVQDLLADGKTRHERRFGEPFGGQVIPFGAMVGYHPISARDQSRLWNTSRICIDRGRIWKVDTLVADIEELENLDASEIHARRLNAKEVLTPRSKLNELFEESV